MTPRHHPLLVPALLILLVGAAMGSVMLGAVAISTARIWAVLTGGGDAVARAIIIDLRLPRMLLGLLVGAMLGLSGAALQGYLRNPLAEPSVLGASNSAALGAVCALYFGLSALHPLVLPLLAITTALVAIAGLFLLAGPSESPLTLILAGIAVATLAGAGISLSLNLSPNPFAAMEIMTWLMGSLENRSYVHVLVALPCIAIGAALLLADGRTLDALTLGEEGAQALGVNLNAARLRMMLGVAIGVGGAVAVSGAIGFVGLIVPHIVRPLTDRSPSAVLWPSLLGGAVLLTLADIGVRLIPSVNELKLGVVTAMLGVPVFLIHLMRERRLW
ncbi:MULTISPECIES: FecCD family ABC transporter permease [unclassified Sphingobium]|uniref:FecCD family ABC transporter permease n=1 Tax=unclassified Sphingobium TaxID=2611147 RepID=UPI000D175400|nr:MULTISPECIES: iron ABC transporter permease [unclassified Sphingobium]MBG6118883.1 iron complex transport system permease protein [Sphingobium sp. JAI105]PSO13501.1 ABC transporter permease [Sphingobium sp. AEW4]TWD10487.1 iron complex transport system permease protein [Sphingobium sp. AEW010]TWD28108.1 iron complex transport system permease protein [Sphingobium sp. AEW013]TWD28821.1 iron complex transport system permease protein [Sphingobium sp. AEW001]